MFTTPLRIEEIENNRWKLINRLQYETGFVTITVPTGFVTKLTPWHYCTANKATVLHEYMLTKESREIADNIMLDAMKTLEINSFSYFKIFIGLRITNLFYNLTRNLRWKK